jgi:hypothetical protein
MTVKLLYNNLYKIMLLKLKIRKFLSLNYPLKIVKVVMGSKVTLKSMIFH